MKKLLSILCLVLISMGTSGCLKRDNLEDISIYTTVYPFEYITSRLYGAHSTVLSIYPDGENPNTYKLTKKQVKDYSKTSLFVFNGLSPEKEYVAPMLKSNKKMKIIDPTLSMEYSNNIEELWLDPSNFLMLSQNIKNGLLEYINNHYLKTEIIENYNELKLDVSNIDAKLKLLSESSNNPTIIVSSDLFKFLEKYNMRVISLEENDNLNDKTIYEAKQLIKSGQISYIFTNPSEEVNKTVKDLAEETGVQLISIHNLSNISEDERNAKKDYISIMNENIDLLKNELYDE